MIYERILIPDGQFGLCYKTSSRPLYNLFVYLAYTTGNSFQYGIGYETRDTLQRTHVMTGLAHLAWESWLKERIEAQGIMLKTERLVDKFDGHNFLILHSGPDDGVYRPANLLDKNESAKADPYIYLGKEFIAAVERITQRVKEETEERRAQAEIYKNERRAAWEADQVLYAEWAEEARLNRQARKCESQIPPTESQICPES